jgi:ParB-like chromosome segregation protein Spo0J
MTRMSSGKPAVTIEELKVSELVPNGYNANEMDLKDFAALRKVSSRLGAIPSPLIVRCLDEGTPHQGHKHEIVDGYHRWLIAKELGLRTVACDIRKLDSIHAMALCYQVNSLRGSPRPFLEAALFRSILDGLPEDRRTNENLAEEIGIGVDKVASRLSLLRIAHIAREMGAEEMFSLGVWEELAKAHGTKGIDDHLVREAVREMIERTKSMPDQKMTRSAARELIRKLRLEGPKPAMVLTSACYMCGAEDETVIWTKSGNDRDIMKVVNRAKLKSFEKNLVQERDASETKEVRRERVILSEFSVGVNYVEGRGASSTIPKPVVELLGNPKEIVFEIRGKKVEVKGRQ